MSVFVVWRLESHNVAVTSTKCMNKIDENIKLARADADGAQTLHSLIHEIKSKYLGKSCLLADLATAVKTASPDQRPVIGADMKRLKDALEDIFKTRSVELERLEIDAKLKSSAVDGSASLSYASAGSLHPLHLVANQVLDLFKKYGCQVYTDPEITNVWYNFDALNMPLDHPARQMHDTFYLDGVEEESGQQYVLRTHNTGVDVKISSKIGAPVRSVAFGKVFRRDLDSTHSPMFHQFDFLLVDKDMNLARLRFILNALLQDFFQTDEVELRLRPSFFPFTEPSVEVDVRYSVKDGKIVLDKNGDQFMEILGCGVLRPVVMRNCNIDPDVYTGIAGGIGLERLVMLKYGFKDIRYFFKSDLAWLESAEARVLFDDDLN